MDTLYLVAQASALVTFLTEILKKTPVPTKRPEAVAFILSLIVIGGLGYYQHIAVEDIAKLVIAVTAGSFGIYEFGKNLFQKK